MGKYEKCRGRIGHIEKQNGQRAMDKLFKQLNGYTNPPRKKEEDYFFNTVRELSETNSDIRKELGAFIGINGGR